MRTLDASHQVRIAEPLAGERDHRNRTGGGPGAWARSVAAPLRAFLKTETRGGLVPLVAAVARARVDQFHRGG